jgi:mannose-6-phosphate isomerase-like protein (cupin superfamily)
MLKLEKLHEDGRGEIYLILGDLQEHDEITIFTTRKNYARGGCIHKLNNEFCTVLEGKIRYFIGEKEPLEMNAGQTVMIKKNTPHYFVSLEDSIVMEWGATPAEKKEKHLATRKLVDEINEIKK